MSTVTGLDLLLHPPSWQTAELTKPRAKPAWLLSPGSWPERCEECRGQCSGRLRRAGARAPEHPARDIQAWLPRGPAHLSLGSSSRNPGFSHTLDHRSPGEKTLALGHASEREVTELVTWLARSGLDHGTWPVHPEIPAAPPRPRPCPSVPAVTEALQVQPVHTQDLP